MLAAADMPAEDDADSDEEFSSSASSCTWRHVMTPPPTELTHFASPQQVSVRRPGPPHSPLPGTHVGCSSTHFMIPLPGKLVHLALPQHVSVRRPGPPHSPLLGTPC